VIIVQTLSKTWGVREYILASVKRDITSRYLGTQLGFFWVIAQPLAMIAIYTLVFAAIMKPSLPGHESRFAYSINLCAGIVLWQLFSEVISRSVGMFVHNANLLKKVSLPKFSLPVIVALSAFTNFSIIFVLFLGFLVVVGGFPGIVLIAIGPVLLIVIAFALGLGVLLGTVNVFYRDIEQSIAMLLNFWFWLTPIVYPVRVLPEALAAVLEWNPMWPLVSFTQTLFLDGRVPEWQMLVYPATVALLFVVLGLQAYRKLGAEIVDEL